MTMITPSYLGETIEYSSLHACRSTLEDPTLLGTDIVAFGDRYREVRTQLHVRHVMYELLVTEFGMASAARKPALAAGSGCRHDRGVVFPFPPPFSASLFRPGAAIMSA